MEDVVVEKEIDRDLDICKVGRRYPSESISLGLISELCVEEARVV